MRFVANRDLLTAYDLAQYRIGARYSRLIELPEGGDATSARNKDPINRSGISVVRSSEAFVAVCIPYS